MLKEVIDDYRNDWITRCADEAFSAYGMALGSKRIHLKVLCENELSSAMTKIICKLQKKFSRADISSIEDVYIVWAIGCPIKLSTCDSRVIYVTDDPDLHDIIPSGALGLYCGSVFGAGMTDSRAMQHADFDATSVMRFLLAQLFMTAYSDVLRSGVYYAGSGKCSVNGVMPLCDFGFVPVISSDDESYMLDFFREHNNDLFYFANTYDGRLELLHSLLLKCLLEFDRICRKHNIKYYLGGGSLLGAHRHGGIIPWDDDVDVMMLRPDYDKFLRVVEDEISDEMFFQSPETDKYYHSVFTKIRLNGTRFVTEFSSRFPDMHQGIFIDIFVHDKTSKYKPMQKFHQFLTLFARSMVFHKWEGTPMHFYGRFKAVCKLATWYIGRTSMKKLERFQDKVLRLYENKDTGYLYDGTGEHLRHGAFPEKWLGKPRYTSFSGYMLPTPERTEDYLKYSYGDYSKLPSASLRKAGHDIVEVDMGEYST